MDRSMNRFSSSFSAASGKTSQIANNNLNNASPDYSDANSVDVQIHGNFGSILLGAALIAGAILWNR